jgi:hypothetical protein
VTGYSDLTSELTGFLKEGGFILLSVFLTAILHYYFSILDFIHCLFLKSVDGSGIIRSARTKSVDVSSLFYQKTKEDPSSLKRGDFYYFFYIY